jgi:hypothetical protein
MRACWAVAREEAPRRGFVFGLGCFSFLFACLVLPGCVVPGLCEIIQYTFSL